MKLSLIKRIIGLIAIVEGDDDIEIRHLLTDSRELAAHSDWKPEEVLFFAIKTAKNDGAKYIPSLRAQGVRAFVTGNAIEALQDLAAYVRSQFQGTVIGITGSNGKTVVKEWLYQLLKDDYTVIRSPKSYNSQIGVPLSVFLLENADRPTDCKTVSLKDRLRLKDLFWQSSKPVSRSPERWNAWSGSYVLR